jgi:hypothetical protein
MNKLKGILMHHHECVCNAAAYLHVLYVMLMLKIQSMAVYHQSST